MSGVLGDDARWDVEGDEVVLDVRVEPTGRWIRAVIDGHEVASSTRALLHVSYGPAVRPGSTAHELPTYLFPLADVDSSVLVAAGEFADRSWWHVQVGDRRIDHGAWTYTNQSEGFETEGYMTFVWDCVDAWFEEAEEVFEHARDPRHRVDALRSTRDVEVRFEGRTLAHSTEPTLVFETGLPTRYYLPAIDVSFDELIESDLVTRCPYKGAAKFWSATDAIADDGADVAWSYPDPIPQCPGIAGLVAFYNEKVSIIVDGVEQRRPVTPWS